MLSDYGVENAATKIADKAIDIFEIQTPFITQFGGDFVPVYQVDSDKVRYIWRGKDTTNTVSDFLNAWSGVILLAEPSENVGEPDYKANRKKELLHATQQYLLLSAIALLLVLACITNNLFTTPVPTVPIVLTVLNLSGSYISYLLVQKQLHSQYADKICSLFKQHDCNKILASTASRPMRRYSGRY
jgi:ABC-type bacteriocin/lantibiotic exporter with double-glycine peptidase domain